MQIDYYSLYKEYNDNNMDKRVYCEKDCFKIEINACDFLNFGSSLKNNPVTP